MTRLWENPHLQNPYPGAYVPHPAIGPRVMSLDQWIEYSAPAIWIDFLRRVEPQLDGLRYAVRVLALASRRALSGVSGDGIQACLAAVSASEAWAESPTASNSEAAKTGSLALQPLAEEAAQQAYRGHYDALMASAKGYAGIVALVEECTKSRKLGYAVGAAHALAHAVGYHTAMPKKLPPRKSWHRGMEFYTDQYENAIDALDMASSLACLSIGDGHEQWRQYSDLVWLIRERK